MIKLKERSAAVSIILIGFLMGAMFVIGGLVAYKFYFPNTVLAEVNTSSGVVNLGPSDITQTVKQVSPAVVNIEAFMDRSAQVNPYMNDPFFRDFFGGQQFDTSPQTQRSAGVGTGFIFDKSGLIITNQHVIQGATEIEVTMSGFKKPVKAKEKTGFITKQKNYACTLRLILEKLLINCAAPKG